MEKRKAQYSLSKVKSLIKEGKCHITRSATLSGFADFSCTAPEIKDHVLKLKTSDLYKSMTSLHDHTLWHDVYRLEVKGIMAYIKIQILEDEESIVISFKRKD